MLICVSPVYYVDDGIPLPGSLWAVSPCRYPLSGSLQCFWFPWYVYCLRWYVNPLGVMWLLVYPRCVSPYWYLIIPHGHIYTYIPMCYPLDCWYALIPIPLIAGNWFLASPSHYSLDYTCICIHVCILCIPLLRPFACIFLLALLYIYIYIYEIGEWWAYHPSEDTFMLVCESPIVMKLLLFGYGPIGMFFGSSCYVGMHCCLEFMWDAFCILVWSHLACHLVLLLVISAWIITVDEMRLATKGFAWTVIVCTTSDNQWWEKKLWGCWVL